MGETDSLKSTSLLDDPAASAPEVIVHTEKEVSHDEGKETAPGRDPEVVPQENLPEAIDEEGAKEVVDANPFSATSERSDLQGLKWLKDYRRRWIYASILLMVAIAIGLGVGLGVTLGKGSRSNNPTTTTSDASAAPSPAGVSIPTGTYAVVLDATQEIQDECLTQAEQRPAWDCSLAPNSHLGMTIQQISSGTGLVGSIFAATDNATVAYGASVRDMNTTSDLITTVYDTQDSGKGLAFFFQQFYDKVVVVPEASLSAPTAKIRRGTIDQPIAINKRNAVASPGEKPWFCIFNNTLLEVFIYVNQIANTSPSLASNSTFSTSNATEDTWTQLDQYPLVVKLEERRVANNTISPYCQQYQMLDNGEANWIGDSNGNPIILDLDETDADFVVYQIPAGTSSSRKSRRDTTGSCHCQWTRNDS